MAKRRLQVEGPTSAVQSKAVASVVDTYVRPAKPSGAKSDLEQFVAAVTPAFQADAKARKEQALKLQREAEKGIAAKRAADVKLGIAKAQREAGEDFLNNQDEYFSLSSEQVAERRARIMQPYLDQALQSGDQLLIDAFNADNEMANLAFFTKVYDPAKRQRVFEDDMSALTAELIAISESNVPLGDPEVAGTPMDQTLAKMDLIEDTFNKYQSASNYSFRDMNDYVMQNGIAARVAANGRDALYRWGESKKFYDIGRYQKQVKTMNNELATRDKALLKAQDPIFFQNATTQGITSFLDAIGEGRPANVGELGIGNTITLPSGATQTVTEKDVVNSFEAYADQTSMSPALRLDFYKRTGFMPSKEKNLIQSGISFFQAGDMESEANQANAAQAFTAIRDLRAVGIDVPESLVSKDMQQRFKIIELWAQDEGSSFKDAVIRAQDIDTSLKPSAGLRETIQDKIGTMFFTDHGETVNNQANISAIAEDVALFMQSGIGDEDKAIAKAIEVFEKDHVIHTASNGVKITFKQLNTDVNVSSDITSTLDTTAKAISDLPAMQNLIANQYPLAEDAGVYIANVNGRPDIVRVGVVDGSGTYMGQLFTMSKTQLLNDQQLVNNLIAKTIEVAKEAGVNTESINTTSSIADIEDPFLSPDDMMIAQQGGFDLPTKEEFRATMERDVGLIGDPLKAAGEAIAPALQSIKEAVSEVFAQEQLDVPELVDETIDRVAPAIVQAEGGVGNFFEEELAKTKRKLTNNKAIAKATDILSDIPELVTELGLDVRGFLAGGGKSARGITVKEQATIARSIIAMQEAGERQQDVETSQDLTDALVKASTTKGVSEQDILEKVIKPMAFHESDGTMDPNLKQYGDGPARGLMQYEPDRFKTSVQRAKNYHEIVGQDLPEWIASIDTSGDDKTIQQTITKLSANQQMALAVYDLLQHPTADISKVINGEQGITEFWLDNWWAGSDDDRFARAKSFRASLEKYNNQ